MTFDEFVEHWGDDWGATTLPFVRSDFEKVVRAECAKAIAAERERCAKIIDAKIEEHLKNANEFWTKDHPFPPHDTTQFCEGFGCSSLKGLAEAIRSQDRC